MTTDSNPLGLYIPPQTIEYPDAPYIKPKEAERWIADLPVGHIGETARLIYKAIAEINRIPLPAQQRFKVMELFRKPLSFVSTALQKHYIGQAFPLSPKNQKIAELTRELQWEFAIGYKIIIEARLSNKSKVDNKTLVSSIHRAMFYLGENLFTSYLIYLPTNEQAWLELHHLYLLSEHNSLVDEKINDPLNPNMRANTVNRLYQHIILLSLANPYRLSQAEIIKLHGALYNWVKYSHLHKLEDPNNPAGLFAIDLEHNKPPTYYSAPLHGAESTFIRIVDTSNLTRVIREQMERSENDISPIQSGLDPKHIGNETLKRLVLAWGAVPKRNFSRKGKKERISVTLGLSATHYFIQKQYDSKLSDEDTLLDDDYLDQELMFNEKADFDTPTTKNPGDENSQPDIWDIAQNPNLRTNKKIDIPVFSSIEEQQAPDPLASSAHEIYSSYQCLLINESAGGYCISWESTVSTKTVVGSLIGVKKQDPTSKNEWSIGVIRWIKATEDNQMYLGIELLSPSGQSIASKNISRKRKTSDFSRTLLLPELRNIKQPQTLITQSLYQVGDKLELDIHGQSIKVKLTKLLENTSALSQFQFSIIRTVKNVAPTDKLDRVKNFDSLWSSI
ncbi:MAG: hypothetical protein OEM38_00590 [Gammaproteobacteria bacterium]|nr:hypothetical protein [Gammaproteobacteria bacterium]